MDLKLTGKTALITRRARAASASRSAKSLAAEGVKLASRGAQPPRTSRPPRRPCNQSFGGADVTLHPGDGAQVRHHMTKLAEAGAPSSDILVNNGRRPSPGRHGLRGFSARRAGWREAWGAQAVSAIST